MSSPDLNDLITHKDAWRAAIVGMITLAESTDTRGGQPDDDADLSYWQHELRAYDRTFALFGPR